MKTNNPKPTSSDPRVDQFLTAVGRLSLVHLIKMDPAMVRDISSQAGLPDAQSLGQDIASPESSEQQISSLRSAGEDVSSSQSAEQDGISTTRRGRPQ